MHDEDIIVGHFYRAARPQPRYDFQRGHHFNDREVIWISDDRSTVQYDGPAVQVGRKYPKVSMHAFLSWVGEPVDSVRDLFEQEYVKEMKQHGQGQGLTWLSIYQMRDGNAYADGPFGPREFLNEQWRLKRAWVYDI